MHLAAAAAAAVHIAEWNASLAHNQMNNLLYQLYQCTITSTFHGGCSVHAWRDNWPVDTRGLILDGYSCGICVPQHSSLMATLLIIYGHGWAACGKPYSEQKG